MFTQRQRFAVLNGQSIFNKFLAEIVFYHCKRFGVTDNRCSWILFQKSGDISRMVGLHMQNYEVVGLSFPQNAMNITLKLTPAPVRVTLQRKLSMIVRMSRRGTVRPVEMVASMAVRCMPERQLQ